MILCDNNNRWKDEEEELGETIMMLTTLTMITARLGGTGATNVKDNNNCLEDKEKEKEKEAAMMKMTALMTTMIRRSRSQNPAQTMLHKLLVI